MSSNEYYREYYKKNAEKMRKRQREWRINHLERSNEIKSMSIKRCYLRRMKEDV